MSNKKKTEYTPTDEKVLAGHFVWLATVKALHIQGSLDLSILAGELQQATQRLLDIGETGAAPHVQSHLDQINLMMLLSSGTPSGGGKYPRN
ncbi:hypothetical protein ACFLB9_004798 [Salmonella enterica]